VGRLQTADLLAALESSDWIEASCAALPAWIG
jgi:hypothetical protein